MSSVCPACENKKRALFTKSKKKDFSLNNYIYFKCLNCLSLYVDTKNLSEKKLEYLHLKAMHNQNNFSFKKKSKKSKKPQSLWFKKYKNLIKVNKQKNVIDIGCGTGELCYDLKKMGFTKIYGFDQDANIIKMNRNNYKNIIFFQSNFEEFHNQSEIKNIKFDYIFLHGVLEHAYNPSKLINRIKKLLKPNGRIFITVPSGENLQIKILKSYSWVVAAPYHRTLFTKKGLEILIKRNKLKVSRKIPNNDKIWGWTRGISWLTKTNNNYIKWRKDKNFRKFDFLIDEIFEKISSDLNMEQYIHYEISY